MTTRSKTTTQTKDIDTLPPRPKRLTDAANRDYHATQRGFFPYSNVPRAAQALLRVKTHFSKPDVWRAWKREHYAGGLQGARDCLLIYKHWETPKLKEITRKTYDIAEIAKLLREK